MSEDLHQAEEEEYTGCWCGVCGRLVFGLGVACGEGTGRLRIVSWVERLRGITVWVEAAVQARDWGATGGECQLGGCSWWSTHLEGVIYLHWLGSSTTIVDDLQAQSHNWMICGGR